MNRFEITIILMITSLIMKLIPSNRFSSMTYCTRFNKKSKNKKKDFNNIIKEEQYIEDIDTSSSSSEKKKL